MKEKIKIKLLFFVSVAVIATDGLIIGRQSRANVMMLLQFD